MNTPLNLLIVEDSPNDAELLLCELRRAGFEPQWQRVETEPDYLAALKKSPDLILSDYAMPQFNGLRALELLQAAALPIPFILVSGTVGEETAVEAIQKGAADYLLKDRLIRLAPAVRRALREVAERAEHQRVETQLIAAQKTELIGQLAGGVAHDFNNILAVIMGNLDLIATELSADNPLQQYAEEIRHASERAVGLTRQLLVFSRRQTVQLVVLNLNDVVQDLQKMLRRLIDEHIDFKVVPGEPIGNIKADAGYVGQLLMNLVVNARDAMPRGGKLIIATGNATLDENYARQHPSVRPGHYAMLSVTDTGIGMTEEVKAHIFEAFFTTKPSGKGTGLGLATCQTIVQQSGGHIDVTSELGKGSTFRIYFPRVDQPAAEAAAIPSGTVRRGTETLLLVEDERAVRHMARRVLAAQGYEVLTAVNGQDGLHVARQHKGSPIRLVIADIVMPLMDGKVMAEWLKTAYPDLKILFTSGYLDHTIEQEGVAEPGLSFLAKPYTPATLARKVRDMLDQETGPRKPAGPAEAPNPVSLGT